ncbi:ABC transporter ATP-binding protein, partial [Listeria monocytogenes]|nr:ABC transporter ATP-binding protein [Listeria monocytogenes]
MEAMNEQDEMLVMSGKEHREVLKRMLSYTKYHIPSLIWTGVLVLLVTLADVFAPILIKIFLDDYLTPMNLEMQALLILGAGYLGLT